MNKKTYLDYVIFVPARDNSKRVPGKNMKEIAGKPLLQYTLDCAVNVQAKLWKRNLSCVIALTTNSLDIMSWAKSMYNDSNVYYHLRNQELAQDHVQTDEVCLDVFRSMEYHDFKFDTMSRGILLQPTSPSRTSNEVLNAIAEADCLFEFDAEKEHKTWCFVAAQLADGFYWKRNSNMPMDAFTCINDDPRFRQGKQWIPDDNRLMHENGSIYLFPLLENLSYCRIYRMPPYYIVETKVMIDVDTKEDFERAEELLK